MLRFNNSPIARALSSARSSARVSSPAFTPEDRAPLLLAVLFFSEEYQLLSTQALVNDAPRRLEEAPRLRRLF